MIFVTVGAQLPFDRLLSAVDSWAEENNRTDVFAQTGRTKFQPSYIEAVDFLDAGHFKEKCASADLIVAHAGMGSIITAMEYGKPILVMPRMASLRETRNDHQLATAKHFLELQYISVAFDEQELVQKLNSFTAVPPVDGHRISSAASPELLHTIREFVESN